MVIKTKLTVFFACVFIIFSLINVSAFGMRLSGVQRSMEDVQWFSDLSSVRGGRSTLVRNDDWVSMHLNTNGLEPGTAATVWWVIFNHPERCTHPQGGFRCGERDLAIFGGSSSVGSSVLYADGSIIDNRGEASFGASLSVGEGKSILFGNGLTNPRGADIHLIVHSHGRLIRGLTHEMTHTFGAGCNNAPNGTGMPGPNTCFDLQFSVHEAE